MTGKKAFLPALRFAWLAPLYDPLIRWTLPEREVKRELLERARIGPGRRVVDLGCGTGTLAILVKKAHPDAEVRGVDADAAVLAIARRKAEGCGAEVSFVAGSASRLDLAEGSVDRVLSSLFFHHLETEVKREVLREALRVLRPGGEIHIADWGRPQNLAMRAAFLLVQALDGFETTADSVRGALPELLRASGFEAVREGTRRMTVFGTLALYEGRKPGAMGER